MKRINYSQQGIDVELVLTRDPFNCEWLAVARWESTSRAGPSLYSMPPLSATASEADAWEAAKQWANRLVMRDCLKTAGLTAKTATAPNSHTSYALR